MAITTNQPPKIVSGARCKVGFMNGDTVQYIGIYNTVQFSVRYDVTPAWILGRYSAATLEYTAAEVVTITATGYRIVDNGPHVAGQMPKLQDLLNGPTVVFSVLDRQTNKEIARIHPVLPAGFDTTITAKQLEEMTLTYVGIYHDDETTLDAGGTAESQGSMEIDEGSI